MKMRRELYVNLEHLQGTLNQTLSGGVKEIKEMLDALNSKIGKAGVITYNPNFGYVPTDEQLRIWRLISYYKEHEKNFTAVHFYYKQQGMVLYTRDEQYGTMDVLGNLLFGW